MIDTLAAPLPWLVALLLGIGLVRQFAVSGRTGLLLDRLAIVPQWKFFGQSTVVSDPSVFDDVHLLARRCTGSGEPGEWQPLVWRDERAWIEALWNPALCSRTALGEAIQHLVACEDDTARRLRPTALSYLTVLRRCLEHISPVEGETIQFAIVQTRGRGDDASRPLTLRFLSAWHVP